MAHIKTQKLYLGDNPIEDVRFAGHKIITQLEGEPGKLIDSSTVLFLDSTDVHSYDGTGTTWYDLSTSGNNASGDAFTSYWNSNGYFDFDIACGVTSGDTAVVTGDSSMDIFDGDFTVQFVMTIDEACGLTFSDLVGPFGVEGFNSNPGVGLLINRDSGDANYKKLTWYMNNASVLTTSAVFSNIGDWFVIQVVRSGSTLTVYADNSSVGSTTNSTNANNTNDVFIGRGVRSAARYWMGGKLANIAFYDKALSSAERLQNVDYFKYKLGF